MHARGGSAQRETLQRVLPGAVAPRLVEAVHDEHHALSAGG